MINSALGATEFMEQFDRHWMQMAVEHARSAAEQDEVPVGAVIIRDGEQVAAASNQRESLKDPTAHAEMIAITQAAASVDNWRLSECTLYVTLEPCVMCAGAIVQSRIQRVVFGAVDPKGGAVHTLYRILEDSRLNHQCMVTGQVMADECGQLLTDFFSAKRAMGKK